MQRTAVWAAAMVLGVVATVGAGLLMPSQESGLAPASAGPLSLRGAGRLARLAPASAGPTTETTVAAAPSTTAPAQPAVPTSAPTRPTIPPGLTDISVSDVAADALPGQGAPIQASPDEGAHIGAIEIPKIDLLIYMYEGVQLTTLDQGPAHWPGTALPGQAGNTVFAGHRTSMNAAFADLDQLEEGDQVIFHNADGDHTYEVEYTEIVDPSALWIADQTEEATATLFACHPKGSVSQRIVVRLRAAEPGPHRGRAAGLIPS